MNEIIIGIDIGGTNSVFGAVTPAGECIAKNSIKTNGYSTAAEFADKLCSSVKKLADSVQSSINGVGIGAPNGNYYTGCIENAPNLKWKGTINLAEMINERFGVDVLLTNDANAGALGEKIFGGAKQMHDFVFITLGTGLGSGIFVNNELVYGHDGFAGEVGHTTAIRGGRLCGCGRLGCLETYVSAPGIVKTYNELIADKPTSGKPATSAKEISGLALSGSAPALEAFEITGRILGEKLADVVAVTSPEAIFLFGGLAQSGELIFKPVKEHLEINLLQIFRNKVKILPSMLPENDAAILGAAALIMNKRSSK